MPDQKQTECRELPNKKLEYSTCVDFCKYSGGIQLTQVSVFIAIMSAAIYFLLGKDKPDPSLLPFLKFGAALIAFCSWAVQESHAYLASRFCCRARELEVDMSFNAFSTLPKITLFWCGPSTWAFRLIYPGFALFWVLADLSDNS